MTDRPKIPVVRRKAAPTPASGNVPPPSLGGREGSTSSPGTTPASTSSSGTVPAAGPRGPAIAPRRSFHTPNAIPAPREAMMTPSRPIMRDAPVGPVSVRTFGSSNPKKDRFKRQAQPKPKRARPPRPAKVIKPPTPPKPRPPAEVFPMDELSFKTLRAVQQMTERNAALPQATSDTDFVPGATYRDIRRVLELPWPDARDAVQRLRPHGVLKVGRFFGRFGPVFQLSDYGTVVLAAVDAGQPIPAPPPELQAALDAAKAAFDAWAAAEQS